MKCIVENGRINLVPTSVSEYVFASLQSKTIEDEMGFFLKGASEEIAINGLLLALKNDYTMWVYRHRIDKLFGKAIPKDQIEKALTDDKMMASIVVTTQEWIRKRNELLKKRVEHADDVQEIPVTAPGREDNNNPGCETPDG